MENEPDFISEALEEYFLGMSILYKASGPLFATIANLAGYDNGTPIPAAAADKIRKICDEVSDTWL